MPQGYLVTLGDGNLDDADFITASQSTFTTASTIGTGSWIWSGVWDGDGNTYNNITDTGTYYEASDGNVYFVPDTWFTTSGTAEAENPPAYSSTTSDGIVSGTSGNDTIDENYNSDPDGDTLSTGADSISAGAGDDTVIAGEGDDTVDGGTGADSIEGGQGADSIEGGSGADTIYGDTDGVIEGETTTFEWDTQGVADETSVAGGITGNTASGDIQVAMTITQEENFTGASMETNDVLYDFDGRSDTSSIELYGGGSGTGQNAATMTMDFTSNDPANITDEVMNVSFGIFDLDESVGQFLDQVVITAFDANGNPVSVVLTPGDASTITVNNATGTATAIGGSGGSGSVNSLTGYLNVSIAGPVAQIVIDYNNVDTAYGNHAIRVGDLEMTPIQIADPAANADSISGGDDNDLIYGGEGNDDVSGDAGDDSIHGDDGDDTLSGDAGADTIFGGDGADSISGGADNDSVTGGQGNDTVDLGAGDDTFGGWSTDAGDDTVYGGTGDDSINGGADDDELYGGDGDDTLTGAVGDDTLYGGDGDDLFQITDDHEGDTIIGGEDGDDLDVDVVNFSNYASTQGVTVTATGDEAGTYDFDGTAGTGTYTEIEGIEGTQYDDTLNLGADNSGVYVDGEEGDDSITTGSGDDTILAGQGTDTINAGAGDDQIDLGEDSPGNPDQDPDVVVLEDGFGNDIVTNFDAPTPNGDGTFTGIDTLDVTGLYDLPLGDPDRTPVLTNDVTVSNDGSGNALLTFPNGETIVLDGISPTDASDPFYLNAIGIPMPDGTVEGTSGNDTIDGIYTGDPDGDMVDANDAILAGDTGDDDLIYGYGGNDNISAGDGDDEVYGGTGDDTFNINAGEGSDTIEGGEDAGNGDVDTLTFTDSNGPNGVQVTMTGDEDGNYSYPSDGGSGTFTEIEQINLTDQDDNFDGVLATGGNTVDGGDGDDVLTGSSGSDSFIGGSGNDTLNANAGDDTLDGGAGNDTIYGDEGDDVIDGGIDEDVIDGGSGNDTIIGGNGSDTITGGADQDVIYGGVGDVIDGSESGVDNDTLIVSGVDYIDYDTNPENGTVYFDGGGSLTFTNIENVVVSDRDGTVSGTAGDDTINASYTGDPDGDIIDDTDAILVGHEPNDDLVEAGAGNDTVFSGAGDDTVYGGTGNDTIASGTGNDTNYGEAGDDVFFGQGGTDTSYGGAGDDVLNGGTEADTLYGGDDDDRFVQEAGFGNDVIEGGEGGTDNDEVWSTQNIDVTVTATGDEAGTITDGTSTATFSEIESIETEGGDDTINVSADNTGMTIDSGAGNDTITGGDGDNVIDAGSGDDIVFATDGNNNITLGTGDDQVILGDGNDTAFGGTGQDIFHVDDTSGTNTVVGGEGSDGFGDILNSNSSTPVNVTATGDEAGTMTTGTTSVTFSEIEVIQTDSGDDTVDLSGDSAGMTVFAYDGDDTVTGGSGDDSIDAGAGSDVINGGAGDDSINAGTGSDTIVIGEGFGTDNIVAGEDVGPVDVDVVDASGMTSGVDLNFTGPEAGTLSEGANTATFSEVELFTLGSGSDTVTGGAGDELVFAGAGDDTMTGGAGQDTFYGGSGDDNITFAEGDNMSGGSGDDTFTLEDLGEPSNGTITVDGGAGDETGGDTLQLSGLVNLTQAVRDTFVDDGTGSYSGSVTLNDGTILNFSEIENIICFTPTMRIATPHGLVAVEDLEVGDMVVTRDHGLQPIRWIEGRTVPAIDRFAPVRIRSNVLSGQERDLIVSPQHRVLFQGYRAELLFGESEVLVSAKHLVDGIDVTQDEQEMVTYVHMLFDQHEIIFAEGAATESFHPGDIGFSAVSDAAREELFAIFPELRVDPRHYGSTARRCLKAHEAKLVRT